MRKIMIGLAGLVLALASGVVIWDRFSDQDSAAPIEYEEGTMRIASSAFKDNGTIPPQFTCDGSNTSPPLEFSEVPAQTASLALIVDDPDAPAGSANPGWVHWVVYNIPASVTSASEGRTPADAAEGVNDWQEIGYGGPCPPSGTHHYVFTLYALDERLSFDAPPTKSQLIGAMRDHVIEQARLTGLYSRS